MFRLYCVFSAQSGTHQPCMADCCTHVLLVAAWQLLMNLWIHANKAFLLALFSWCACSSVLRTYRNSALVPGCISRTLLPEEPDPPAWWICREPCRIARTWRAVWLSTAFASSAGSSQSESPSSSYCI